MTAAGREPVTGVSTQDLDAVERQLGRRPRGVAQVAHRCPCGQPDVLRTEPRLPDGTPFPTTFYATCPRLTGAISTLETEGLMREMSARLQRDDALAAAYTQAHEHYLASRAELGHVEQIAGISAGGMPGRVKCLHVLAAHSLAAGPGVNPLGDEVLARVGQWWSPSSCAGTAVARPAALPARPRRVGAVDCGTNSIRLLVAERGQHDGALTDLTRRMEVVRLGQDVDRTGVLHPAAVERTLRVARSYAAACRELGVDAVRFVATSASRDVRNADDLVAGVRAVFREAYGREVTPEVVSGDEEARLSFRGATGGLRGLGLEGPYLVVDVGGGSTELVRGTDDVEAARSVDLGCVRLTERHLRSDPPTRAEVAGATADIEAGLDVAAAEVPFAGVRTLVGLAGTVTTVTAHALRLPAYDPQAIHLSRVPVARVLAAAEELVAMPRSERARLPYMHPGRVDVIGAGALLWSCVVARVSAAADLDEVVASEHDILDGIALGQLS